MQPLSVSVLCCARLLRVSKFTRYASDIARADVTAHAAAQRVGAVLRPPSARLQVSLVQTSGVLQYQSLLVLIPALQCCYLVVPNVCFYSQSFHILYI